MKPDARGAAAPPPGTAAPTDAADARLLAALRAMPPLLAKADADAADALNARVMAQWHERHATGAATVGQRGPTLAARLWQRRVWVGSAGLLAVAAVATAVLVTRPDPSIEDLMQPDVLSQMAIGEM